MTELSAQNSRYEKTNQLKFAIFRNVNIHTKDNCIKIHTFDLYAFQIQETIGKWTPSLQHNKYDVI